MSNPNPSRHEKREGAAVSLVRAGGIARLSLALAAVLAIWAVLLWSLFA
jgi:hypothetical protein